MSHNGSVNGYAAYKVANNVKKHYAVGLGIYNVFIYTGGTLGENGQPGTLGDGKTVSIQMDNAIEVPNSKDVLIENACLQTFANEDGALQKFNHIINGVGSGVSSGIGGEGWSRKFLLSYQNGTAIVGKQNTNDQKGKYIGVDTITDIKQLGDDDLDLDALKALVENKKDANTYTDDSYQAYETVYNEAAEVLTTDGLKYATQKDVDQAVEKLQKAQDALVVKVSKDELNKLYTDKKDLKETDYTADSWKAFKDALQNEDATQDEGDQALASLQNAVNSLKTVSGNNDQPNQKPNDQGQSTKPSTGKGHTNKTSSTKKHSKVKTGDDMIVVPYALLAMAAAGGYIALQRKNKGN